MTPSRSFSQFKASKKSTGFFEQSQLTLEIDYYRQYFYPTFQINTMYKNNQPEF